MHFYRPNLAPKQSVAKFRVETCGQVKYKDSLGSRCFPLNDSLTGEGLSRALLFLPAVCIGLGARANLPWWHFRTGYYIRNFPHSKWRVERLLPAYVGLNSEKKRDPGNEALSGMCSLMKLWGDQREQHLDLSEYIDPCTCIRLKRKLQNKTVAWRENKWNCRIWLKTAGTYPVIPRVSRSKPFIYLSSREATQLWQCLNVNTPRFHLQ